MIIANNKPSTPRVLAPSGNHIARCVQMIHIGTAEEEIMGKKKMLNKVRLSWELPDELHTFSEEKGEQPFMVSKEYNLSMHENATLRRDLESWRGKAFTEEQAESFDITTLLGIPCMLNVVHKTAKSGNEYALIFSISRMPKKIECAPQINASFEFNFQEHFDKFESLPDWLQDKIKLSDEYKAKGLIATPPKAAQIITSTSDIDADFAMAGDDFSNAPDPDDELPF